MTGSIKLLALIPLLTPCGAAAQALGGAYGDRTADSIRELELEVGPSDFDAPSALPAPRETSRELLDPAPEPAFRIPAKMPMLTVSPAKKKALVKKVKRTRRELFAASVAGGARLGWKPGAAAAGWYHERFVEPLAHTARDVYDGRTGAGRIKRVAAGTGGVIFTMINIPVMFVGYTVGGALSVVGALGGTVVGALRAITKT